MELQWPLIIFTTFICLAAGLFGALQVAALLDKAYERVEEKGLIIAFVLLIIGGLSSVLHLRTPSRYFGQFGNVTSGINHEIIGMAIVGLLMVIVFYQLKRNGEVSKALRIISVIFCAVLVFVMGHSYIMPSIPIWNTYLLPVFYLANAALLGALCLGALMTSGRDGMLTETSFSAEPTSREENQSEDKKDSAKQSEEKAESKDERAQASLTSSDRLAEHVSWPAPWGKAGLICLAVFAFAILAYLIYMAMLSQGGFTDVIHVDTTTVPPADPKDFAQTLLAGSNAALFWLGVVVLGLAVPAFAFFKANKTDSKTDVKTLLLYICLALLAVIIAGICFRVILYLGAAHSFIY